ncbi:MAG: hypothetical protein KTR31_03025 [Myxococcales bacterium]|nr:hypothetical protein [Myxococcales bacterium]
MMILYWTTVALAGSGPWALSKGDHSVYVGAELQRFRTLHPVLLVNDQGDVVGPEDAADATPQLVEAPTGGPINSTAAKLAVTFGIIDRVEVDAVVPYQRVEAALVGGGACEDFPQNSCPRTQGIGLVDLRLKWQFADEIVGAPLSVAVGTRARLGSHTQGSRARVTNMGEGTNDFGLFLTAGRTARLGSGFYNGFLEVGYLLRPPTDTEPRAPNDEIWADFVAHVAPGQTVCVGPAASLFWRPNGLDFYEIDLLSLDRFSSLRALNVRVGGELVLRDPSLGLSLSATVLQTVVARNNPKDTWIVSAGLSAHNPFRRKRGGQP